MNRVYVAIGPYYWGKSSTPEEAKAQMFKAGLKKGSPYVVKRLPEGATDVEIDNYGTIYWQGGDGSQCEVIEKFEKPVRKKRAHT